MRAQAASGAGARVATSSATRSAWEWRCISWCASRAREAAAFTTTRSTTTRAPTKRRPICATTALLSCRSDAILPDQHHNWLNLSENDWDDLIPVASKEARPGKGGAGCFQLSSLGVVTARDEWVYGDDAGRLEAKVRHLYPGVQRRGGRLVGKDRVPWRARLDYTIKWTRAVKNDLEKGGGTNSFPAIRSVSSIYRPFVKKKLYFVEI